MREGVELEQVHAHVGDLDQAGQDRRDELPRRTHLVQLSGSEELDGHAANRIRVVEAGSLGAVPETHFDYSNLSGRPPGPVLSVAARLLPGVREVQAQVEPYARAWEEHNRAAVQADGPLWVVLGDSMAQGIGASAYDRGWPGQLADRYPTTGSSTCRCREAG